MKTIAIAGVGLIGGSFGLAARRARPGIEVIGIDVGRSLSAALELGIIDRAAPLAEACAVSDLVYVSLPIGKILELLANFPTKIPGNCLVTDAGSTKTTITSTAASLSLGSQFLGGHPMAGKESKGVREADPELFRNRPYILTPLPANQLESPRAAAFVSLLRDIGCRITVMSPEEHDRTVAYSSHLPQLLSTTLAACLAAREDHSRIATAAGPGLMDSTRLALSSWNVWADILETNRAEILNALHQYELVLKEVQEHLSNGSLQEDFTRAETFATALRKLGF